MPLIPLLAIFHYKCAPKRCCDNLHICPKDTRDVPHNSICPTPCENGRNALLEARYDLWHPSSRVPLLLLPRSPPSCLFFRDGFISCESMRVITKNTCNLLIKGSSIKYCNSRSINNDLHLEARMDSIYKKINYAESHIDQ